MADVYIAEGHGRRPDGTWDSGATDGIHSEQRDSKPVAEACTAVLRAYGLEVISESDMADDPNFYGTTDRANRAGVKCVVSFHYDWRGAPPGAFMIATSDEGRRLGWAIEARVAEAGFAIRDYPDDRDNLYLLNNTNMPAVIFECGRIGHEAIDEEHEQRAMGEAAALGILDFLGIEEMTPEQVRQIIREEAAHIASAVWGHFIPDPEGVQNPDDPNDPRLGLHTNTVLRKVRSDTDDVVARVEAVIRRELEALADADAEAVIDALHERTAPS